ncbi:DnaA regulatory inactivator Hda [Pasteurellaceae bacterium HPA106]|uniref:DnaA regulatory inactivator Hda n=1 Tax=Spirabiliibacterium pneumoniae TaxID=221400 RepID=UPI001AAD3FA2|nr:DnaA regulatory inactivator Hda [Spirabiliibacterium pneumoniae]MBE2895876.1 DnaA regulatory inactivator Hda [Spirabiliibacterium pneumoniae]
MRQIPLPIQTVDENTFDYFNGENNPLLLASLHTHLAQVQPHFYFIFGQASTGKSHLLKACCDEITQSGGAASFLPLKSLAQFSPDMLDNLEMQDLVCLDDLHAIAGNAHWERAVFDLYNRINERSQGELIISANAPISELALHLPDLRSRLIWGEVYQLKPLQDSQKMQLLQQRAFARGLILNDDAAQFLLKRHDRDLKSLFRTLDKLEHATLEAQKGHLTIPFLKDKLAL